VTSTAFDAALGIENPYDYPDYAQDPGPGDYVRIDRWFSGGTHLITVSSVVPALGDYQISVHPVPIASVEIVPDTVVIGVGAGFYFQTVLRDPSGDTINPSLGIVTFTSSPSDVIDSEHNWIIGLAPGDGVMVASINGHADTAHVRVASCGGTIMLGDTVDGSLSAESCMESSSSYYSLWILPLPTDGVVAVELTSTSFNTYLSVVDESYDNGHFDWGSDMSSRIEGFLYAGNARIYVRSSTPGATGDFRLIVTTP
jgi:hypothetical protein